MLYKYNRISSPFISAAIFYSFFNFIFTFRIFENKLLLVNPIKNSSKINQEFLSKNIFKLNPFFNIKLSLSFPTYLSIKLIPIACSWKIFCIKFFNFITNLSPLITLLGVKLNYNYVYYHY